MQSLYDPSVTKTPIPDFFSPTRMKLFMKIIQDRWNNNHVDWKPIPKKKREEITKLASEYNEYKLAEEIFIQREAEKFN